MKELKLDLLPGNLYAAKKKAEQQKDKDKEKKSHDQKNIIKLTGVSFKAGDSDETADTPGNLDGVL